MKSSTRLRLVTLASMGGMVPGGAALAQSVPSINTEDATLGSQGVSSSGSIHPSFGVDVRNGDFARGNYDDDAADLDRLPVHVQVGIDFDLHRDAEGKADTWLVARSSNGVHSASSGETTSPHAWYESNNLVALVVTPATGVRAAAIYTIKASPNGISATTHEASLSFAYDAKNWFGTLKPTFAATVRPKGDHGVYTQVGIEPEFALDGSEDGPSLSFPAAIGVGWSGFYDAGSGDRLFANAGVALSKPFSVGTTKWNARAEMLALIRDDRLRRLSGPLGETGTVVPLATIGVSLAY